MVNFLVLPPEINSALMYLGAGSGPMLAAAAAWDGLAGELGSAAQLVRVGDVRVGGRGVAGSGGGGDGERGRPVCGVAERGGGSGAGGGRSGPGGGVGV